ncbi:hypothetical protein [Halomonas korlensis]|uniref:Uncharacterized protein n=1 Tax=Halomonas korlensis TaxID=463301 RepID=A0A1I7FJR4_9GAMM|nr:hypothetical protein [Halomonas korlensis]SFU36388.1 hypothetical protein SAMN04487955_101538 [Halomonas korlensis]
MDTTETMPAAVAARSPRGCNVPVMTQLTKDERRQVEGIAELEVRFLSATARMLLLRGMEQYQTESAVAD